MSFNEFYSPFCYEAVRKITLSQFIYVRQRLFQFLQLLNFSFFNVLYFSTRHFITTVLLYLLYHSFVSRNSEHKFALTILLSQNTGRVFITSYFITFLEKFSFTFNFYATLLKQMYEFCFLIEGKTIYSNQYHSINILKETNAGFSLQN